MSEDETRRRCIFARTQGRCHICRGRLTFANYAMHGRRGAWEIEHSRPRSRGGTDHGNNLYAAHIDCNRTKGVRSTRSARGEHGFAAAPRSAEATERDAQSLGILGGLIGAVIVPPHLRLVGLIAGAVLGYEAGERAEPD